MIILSLSLYIYIYIYILEVTRLERALKSGILPDDLKLTADEPELTPTLFLPRSKICREVRCAEK